MDQPIEVDIQVAGKEVENSIIPELSWKRALIRHKGTEKINKISKIKIKSRSVGVNTD